jgi:hypothetical protein
MKPVNDLDKCTGVLLLGLAGYIYIYAIRKNGPSWPKKSLLGE